MNNQAFKAALFINYFVFAILLNSVGIVILKSQNVYGVDEVAASTLELFKDMPIAIVSFLVASFLPRIGYKKAMLFSLGLVTLACLGMYFGNSFWWAKALFAAVGASFALIKVSVYASIGLVTANQQEHNALMSNIEGVFMFGIALAYFLFPAFNTGTDPDSWLRVYWVLAGLSALSFVFLWRAPMAITAVASSDSAGLGEDFAAMFRLLVKPLVLVFVASAFLFVMIEQGIMTWLPTFNDRVLALPENLAIMMASILAVSLGVGRIAAGVLTRYISWFWVLLGCLVAAMAMVYWVLPLAVDSKIDGVTTLSDIPLLGYAFPIVGLFIAPIYPLLNSVVLSALPKHSHSAMSGLIIIFSAIGGTLGSRLIGLLFKHVGASEAFSYTLLPMALLLGALVLFRRWTQELT